LPAHPERRHGATTALAADRSPSRTDEKHDTRMNRLFRGLLATFNTIASIWVLFLVGLISADVIGRAFFNRPLAGVPEIVKFSIVGMVWLWMAYALRSGAHLRTHLVLRRMGPLGQRIVYAANSLIGIGLFAMIAWLGWYELERSWEFGIFEGEDPVRIPVWPFWGLLVLGAAVTTLQFALDAIRYLREGPSPAEIAQGGH
jgi:TRAP-type C4-dicarboxylate transport system permease small subunit